LLANRLPRLLRRQLPNQAAWLCSLAVCWAWAFIAVVQPVSTRHRESLLDGEALLGGRASFCDCFQKSKSNPRWLCRTCRSLDFREDLGESAPALTASSICAVLVSIGGVHRLCRWEGFTLHLATAFLSLSFPACPHLRVAFRKLRQPSLSLTMLRRNPYNDGLSLALEE
jgi:hypothetical protein